jgi:hypothetical protein
MCSTYLNTCVLISVVLSRLYRTSLSTVHASITSEILLCVNAIPLMLIVFNSPIPVHIIVSRMK